MKAGEAAKKKDIAKLYSRTRKDTKLSLDINKQKEWLDVMKKNSSHLNIYKMQLKTSSSDPL